MTSRYHAGQTEERAVEHSWIGLQQSSAGIGSASQTVGTVQKLASSELHCGAPLQAHVSLGCLYRMLVETDQKYHYLTYAGAADFAASVGVAVEQIAAVVEIDGTDAEIAAVDENAVGCLLKTLKLENSSFPIDQLTKALYRQPVASLANLTDYLSEKSWFWI